MSAVATAHVWARSKATGSNLLVLLAIADACNQECENSYQSVATLSRMARVSESTVHRALKALLEHDEIVRTGVSLHDTNIYRLSSTLTGGVNLTPPPVEGGVIESPEGVSPMTPNPTTNPTTTAGNSPTTSHGGLRGPMTMSWKPAQATVLAVREVCPNINGNLEYAAFRDWHIGRGDGRQATQEQWDALFRNWCARKQTEWERDHPDRNGVVFDDNTGMPVNPRPQRSTD